LKYYENAPDLNIRMEQIGKRTPAKSAKEKVFGRHTPANTSPTSRGNYQKLFVNLGTRDGFYKASFLQFILDLSELNKEVLGKIEMKEINSWIEIEPGAARKMIRAIDGKNYRGRKIRMNAA
jgi:ATP-dependent RNA helicase DeaD